MQHFTTAPPAAAPGLDLFAAAWLERFTSLGGCMLVFPDGRGQAQWRAHVADTPVYEAPSQDWPEERRLDSDRSQDAAYMARTAELLDLLEIVPGGRDAVKAHVRAFPSFADVDGSVGVM